MKVGLFAIGIGAGAAPETIGTIAREAERLGFATLWAPEHVVLFDRQDSRYPYAQTGAFPVPGHVDWLDPFVALAYAAAMTSRIRLATGICLVPEHNPVVLAKEIASLDHLAKGRFALGVGIGWSAEEFAAVGVPFERRAQRTLEYLEVMRRLWSEERVSFAGEFVKLDGARSYPHPAKGRDLPVLFGGESTPALRRVARAGSGWYGFNLLPEEAEAKIGRLREMVLAEGRDPSAIEILVSPYTKPCGPDTVAKYHAAGVHELVLMMTPSRDQAENRRELEKLARDFVETAERLG